MAGFLSMKGGAGNYPALLLWVLTVSVVALIASAPTSTDGQALLGIVAVGIVGGLKPFTAKILPRFILLGTASVIVIRYWTWRLLETLPEPALSAPFILGLILLAVETYSILVFFLNCFITADPTVRPFPAQVPVETLPTVDILVPSYNEPPEMLAITLAAAKNIIYPRHKRTVVLCDDGGTDQRCNSSDPKLAARAQERRATLMALCEELDITYSTRARNEHAKAGNMSAAMEKLTGDLVVVFDADHVPSRDFLARTVGYFVDDPKLFLVQTPHFFINKDPIERNLGLTELCPPENEMFYAFIHRGLDRWGGAFFCGSAAVLRRAALDSVGGFAGETITEDAETALEMHAHGWRSLYLDRAMIAGLQPETFSSFIQQRGRWATGMMQMLLLKNPLFRPGLRFPQRLCYLNSMSFWLFPLIRMAYLLTPLIYLFFGIEIFVATHGDALAYMLSYLAVSFLVQNALYARYRWPLISEIYEVAQAPYLAFAVLKTFLRPRSAKFNVTAKDETLDEDFLSDVHRPLTLLLLLMFAAVVTLVARWILFPGDRTVLILVGSWAVINFILVATAWLSVGEKQQRRASPRVTLHCPGTIWPGSSPETKVRGEIVEASTSGARLKVPASPDFANLKAGDEIVFVPDFPEAPHLQNPVRATIRGMSRGGDGIVFGTLLRSDQPMTTRETVAFLIFGDSENWRKMRLAKMAKKSFTGGVLYALTIGARGLPGLLRTIAREPGRRLRASQTEAMKQKPVHLLAFGDAAAHLDDMTIEFVDDAFNPRGGKAATKPGVHAP
ncbi:MAG: cellulose synthase catalytic subunit (UDP-forming) [Rhodobacteraceae bacterium GWE1_64_9]|nr:MAG: cellulose synthase catalytic subunit (UDP-forming) [Rhodobacteraceae bacterium GWE1_64_9]OHC47290.1 MAG: cellulose synthase catalytic subunit (UDP-forming) [Rhodobacteraceae bacterium GWF1_65_7]HBU14174.1 cellulose synthase catalytic subunit (UDP-forming) [Gemmobacter sp.]